MGSGLATAPLAQPKTVGRYRSGVGRVPVTYSELRSLRRGDYQLRPWRLDLPDQWSRFRTARPNLRQSAPWVPAVLRGTACARMGKHTLRETARCARPSPGRGVRQRRPSVGVDNACCGRVQQKGFGGPCLTVGRPFRSQIRTAHLCHGYSLETPARWTYQSGCARDDPRRASMLPRRSGSACLFCSGRRGDCHFGAIGHGRTCQGEREEQVMASTSQRLRAEQARAVKLSGTSLSTRWTTASCSRGAVTAEPLCGVCMLLHCHDFKRDSTELSVDGGTADSKAPP